jgi:hypothetical protein
MAARAGQRAHVAGVAGLSAQVAMSKECCGSKRAALVAVERRRRGSARSRR